jgi:outer membrane protein
MNPITRAAFAAIAIATIAAAPSGAAEPLTLRKARELALARSSTLRKTELAVSAAELAARSARYARLPSAALSGSGSVPYGANAGSISDSGELSAKISISETLFDGGRTRSLARKGDLGTEAARQSSRQARITLIGQADAAFYSVLSASASVAAASSDLDAAKLRLQIAKTKSEVGAIARADYLQAEAEAASYETALTTSRKNLASARAKLASLTGLAAGTELEPIDLASYDEAMRGLSRLDETGIDKLVSDIVARAKAGNPTLAGQALSIGQAREAIAAARAAFLPTLSAGLSQGYSASKATGSSSAGSISLTASIDLDLWVAKNAVDAAKVARLQAELDGDEAERSLELDVAQAVYEWIAAARAVGSSAKALEYAQSNYDNVLEKFKLSTATASDLSAAEALVSGDKTALIAAHYTFLSDLSTLRGYSGIEDEVSFLEAVL